MNNNNKFLLQIFEKIGAPLFTSVNEVAVRTVMGGQATAMPSTADQAETIAKLLTSHTKTSTALSGKLGLESKDPEADDLQVSLAAVLSPVIANMYQIVGQAPKDDDIEKIVSSFETLGSFSNNFSSVHEGAERLETLPVSAQPQDQAQETLQNITSMVPLINSVSAFPFGQAPEKLLRKIIQRIQSEIDAIKKEIPEKSYNYTGILNAIVTIYSQCHFSEMARIMAMTDKERETGAITIDGVWTMFDQRMELLKTLARAMTNTPETATAQEGTTAPTAPTQPIAQEVPVAAPVTAPPPVAPPVTEQPPAQPVTQTPPHAENASPPEGSSPMSFFSAKKDTQES
ncbi:MAG: hypothetical protein JKY11_08500 [Alphaproteobacteria bacterium]|nr:hypothetical protein [Alphaproteobacteria bacterium]